MHMNSAPHLLTEDRPEYERILDDALRHAHERPDLAAVGERLNPVQLRTMAMAATALITATAATEYEHYVKAREDLRATAAGPDQDAAGGTGADDPNQSGAGIGAVVTVLAPVLAGTAALIFLLVGYLLKMLSPPPSFAGTMVGAGWVFAALTAAAILIAAIGLLIAALRNGSTSLAAEDPGEELPEDVARAREAWRHALLERGILPFLRDALADHGPREGRWRAEHLQEVTDQQEDQRGRACQHRGQHGDDGSYAGARLVGVVGAGSPGRVLVGTGGRGAQV
ncbi:hypothetical protein, partial [Streptomyces laculatispora]|uniref:hypothetical protein n=1 Tax=Streptomyces laculatispora TaxID=887464 RepID=UPI001F5F6526